MTLNSEIGAVSRPSSPLRDVKAPRPAHDHLHDHAHGSEQTHDMTVPAARFSPFLASALYRLGVAVILTGLVWIGVFWAVN